MIGVHRLARQVGDGVDTALRRPVLGLALQRADAQPQVAGDELDHIALTAVVRPGRDDAGAVEGPGVGDLELGGHEPPEETPVT
ncbi:hypothetical protein [Streptomyces sp. NPDC047009]|uniref:hypothetical protein n=1 Tax=Streptomyces sp. NPDC047009 TaxID=3154496 RepID=UPI0034089AEB